MELGCGLGLTGLTVCKRCSVNTYTFTDCHTQVLDLLEKNIQYNFDCHVNERNTSKTYKEISSNQIGLNGDNVDCDADDICGTRLDCDTVSSKSADCDSSVEKSGSSLCNGEDESTEQLIRLDTNSDTVEHDSVSDSDRRLLFNGDISSDQVTNIKEFIINERACCKCIRLAKLDWENIDVKLVEKLADTDVILAAGNSLIIYRNNDFTNVYLVVYLLIWKIKIYLICMII